MSVLVAIRQTILGPLLLMMLMVVMIAMVIMMTIMVITMMILLMRTRVTSVLVAMDIAMVVLKLLMLLININKYRKIKHTFIIKPTPPPRIALLIKMVYYIENNTWARGDIKFIFK